MEPLLQDVIGNFLQAAAKTALAAPGASAENEVQRLHARGLRQRREYNLKLDAAFRDFDATVAPLLEALNSMPKNGDGKIFMVKADKILLSDGSDGEPIRRSLLVQLAYSQPVDPNTVRNTRDPGSLVHGMVFASKNDDGFVSPKLDALPLLEIELNSDGKKRETLTGSTYKEKADWVLRDKPSFEYGSLRLAAIPYDAKKTALKSMTDIPALIGAWVGAVAPERMPEIKALLGSGDAPATRPTPKKNRPAPKS